MTGEVIHNTGNPVPSTDAYDREDNTRVFDGLLNGSDLAVTSRTGESLKSWKGFEEDFRQYLAAQGYEAVYLLYGPGVTVLRQTQLVERSGELYRVTNAADLPLVLSGTWATDAVKLTAVGDAGLRAILTSPGGAAFVARGSSNVDADLSALESEQVVQNDRLDLGGFPIKIYDATPANPPLYTPYMIVLPPDVTKPTMTGFVLQNNQYNPVPITTLTATDDRGVTGWWLGHSSLVPSLADAGWSTAKPTAFTTSGTGSQTVYARARDAAGNISDALSSTVTVLSKSYQNIWWPGDVSSSAGYAVRGGGTDQAWVGMKFVMPTTQLIDTIDLKLFSVKNVTYPGSANVLVQIRTGSYTGTPVIEGSILDFNDGTYQTRTATLTAPVSLTAGTTYYLTVTVNTATALTGDTLYRAYVDTAQTGEIATKFNANAWATGTGLTPLRLGIA